MHELGLIGPEGQVPDFVCGPGVIINSAFFLSQVCLSLDSKAYGHSANK